MLLKAMSSFLSAHLAIQVLSPGWIILSWFQINNWGRGCNKNVLVYIFLQIKVGGIYAGRASKSFYSSLKFKILCVKNHSMFISERILLSRTKYLGFKLNLMWNALSKIHKYPDF